MDAYEFQTQQEWLKENRGADLICAGSDGQPAIAIYVNPVWRFANNSKNLQQFILNAIQHYETEI